MVAIQNSPVRVLLALFAAICLLPLVQHAQEPNRNSAQSVRDTRNSDVPRPDQSGRDKKDDERPSQSIRKRPDNQEPRDTKVPEVKGDFAESSRAIRQGVFLVGGPGVGIGTAWVISKEHRLLITNAHVADMYAKAARGKVMAMMNGSDVTYQIERAWYHPGVKRFPTEDENIAVRSGDIKLGPVSGQSPDVAILQLSADGPPLPVELKIASLKTMFDLQASPAAILGFPGHDTQGWPEQGKRAQATFHTGVVSRVTDFEFEGGGRDEFAQLLQYTMETWGGYSGSPIFLANGQVIGLHHMGRRVAAKGGNPERTIAHGVRADTVWELVTNAKLSTMVPIPVQPENVHLQRWLEYDKTWDLYRKLVRLSDEGNDLIQTRLDFVNGIAKCDEAINLYPRFAPAYIKRSYGYNNWYYRQGSSWPLERRIEMLLKALDSAEMYKKLHPVETIDGYLACTTVLNNLGYESKDQKYNRAALNDSITILNLKKATIWDRSRAMSAKAVALSNLNRSNEALEAHNAAIMMDPDNTNLWDSRASYFEGGDRLNLARYDRNMARALRKKTMLLRDSGRKDYKVVSEVKETLTSKEPADNRGAYQKSWSVELEQGYFYQIDLKSPEFGVSTKFDPMLRLYDDKNKFIQEDDDGGGYPHARIFITPSATMYYTLTVTSYEARQTGPYVLKVVKLAKDS